MNIRTSADQAGWSIREAAWGLEERVLWRGSDAAGRALEATAPLQRLIQTKLTWPLADAIKERGTATRAGIATTAVAAAIAAGVAGASFAPDAAPTPSPTAALGPLPTAPRPPPARRFRARPPRSR